MRACVSNAPLICESPVIFYINMVAAAAAVSTGTTRAFLLAKSQHCEQQPTAVKTSFPQVRLLLRALATHTLKISVKGLAKWVVWGACTYLDLDHSLQKLRVPKHSFTNQLCILLLLLRDCSRICRGDGGCRGGCPCVFGLWSRDGGRYV